jgi:hypothetical protein
MKKQLGLLATLMLTGVAACGGADQEVGTGDGAYATESAIIAFGGDWSIEQTGRLVEGGAVRVKYDSSRLPTCRGNQNGGPAWTITGYYSIGGSEAQTFYVAGFSPTSTVTTPLISLDRSGELEIWFQNTSRWGCSGFDSNDGANYTYTVK